MLCASRKDVVDQLPTLLDNFTSWLWDTATGPKACARGSMDEKQGRPCTPGPYLEHEKIVQQRQTLTAMLVEVAMCRRRRALQYSFAALRFEARANLSFRRTKRLQAMWEGFVDDCEIASRLYWQRQWIAQGGSVSLSPVH